MSDVDISAFVFYPITLHNMTHPVHRRLASQDDAGAPASLVHLVVLVLHTPRACKPWTPPAPPRPRRSSSARFIQVCPPGGPTAWAPWPKRPTSAAGAATCTGCVSCMKETAIPPSCLPSTPASAGDFKSINHIRAQAKDGPPEKQGSARGELALTLARIKDKPAREGGECVLFVLCSALL